MAKLAITEAQTRSTLLGEGTHAREVSFTLQRSRRRTMQLSIDHRGLRLAIPTRVSEAEALRFIHSKAAWVLAKLDDWANRTPAAPAEIADGMRFAILGQPCTLRMETGLRQARWQEGFYGRELILPHSTGSAARTHLLKGLHRYALAYFQGRAEEYAYVLQQFSPGTKLPSVRLSNARTRWGSCSQRSGIRLNWRLIHLPNAQVDYVVAHEIAHLLEMNHSARFWAVVARLCPDYEAARDAMRDAGSLIPEW